MDFTGNGTDGSGSGSSSSNGTSDDHTRSIQRALASLQLPHMPLDSDLGEEDADGSTLPIQTFRILVVADVDLSSTSALAEYTLQQKNQVFDASRIDLCIACGPFCRDQDLLPYLRGKQKAARQNLHASQSKSSETANTPFFRSQEETVALEGLMTAALSQLESIVCRVVYCPGSSDPLTTLLSAKRLTPNSRNVHRQWLPMVPGLGCAALFYLDAPQILMPKKSSSKGDGGDGGGGQSYEDQDEDPQDTSENDEEDTMALLTEQLIGIQQSSEGYSSTLQRLLQLAPKPKQSQTHSGVAFHSLRAQTVLVTHYVHGLALTAPTEETQEDSAPANDSPSWCTNKESGMSWPATHDTFLESSSSQHQLCLEIASGSAAKHSPKVIKSGGTTILLPGSLRERGEFCLVDMALMERETTSTDSASDTSAATTASKGSGAGSASGQKASSKKKFAWKVSNVDIHRLGRFRTQK